MIGYVSVKLVLLNLPYLEVTCKSRDDALSEDLEKLPTYWESVIVHRSYHVGRSSVCRVQNQGFSKAFLKGFKARYGCISRILVKN